MTVWVLSSGPALLPSSKQRNHVISAQAEAEILREAFLKSADPMGTFLVTNFPTASSVAWQGTDDVAGAWPKAVCSPARASAWPFLACSEVKSNRVRDQLSVVESVSALAGGQ